MKRVLLVVAIILLGILLSSCKESAPDDNRILKDLSEYEFQVNDSYSLIKIETRKAKIGEESSKYWCKATFENASCVMTGNILVEYSYYQQGGWLLENCTDEVENEKYEAIAGASEKDAIKIASVNDSDEELYDINNITVKKHKTDLKNGTDTIILALNEKGVMFDETGTITIEYTFDENYGWQHEDPDINTTTKLHPKGIWSAGSGYDNYIKILGYEKGKINVAKYSLSSYKKTEKDGNYSEIEGYSVLYKTYSVALIDYDPRYTFEGYSYRVYEENEKEDEEYDDEENDDNEDDNDYIYLINKNSFKNKNSFNDWFQISDKELEDELSKHEFLYGFYDDKYLGDSSKSIIVPNVKGKSISVAKEALHKKGFGEIYVEAEGNKIDGVYTINEDSNDELGYLEVTGKKFDKNSKLKIY